jgi:integrase
MKTPARAGRLKALGLKAHPAGLTEELVARAALVPMRERYTMTDAAGRGAVPGLYVRVGAARPGFKGSPVAGHATYYVQGRVNGVLRQVRLGPAGVLSVDDARKRARAVLGDLLSGVDVVTEKKAQKARSAASSTVREYVEEAYWKRHLQHLKSAEQEKRRLMVEWAPIGDLRLEAVTAEDIESVLADRRARGIADGTLQRDWSAIRAMFRAAWKEGRIAALPFRARPQALKGINPNKRLRWLGQNDPTELERFEVALKAESREIQTMLILLALTGMRRGELLGLRDSEVNARLGLATLPSERSKSGKTRVVRLNPEVMELLKGWPLRGTGGEYFPGSLATWKDRIRSAWLRILEAAEIVDLKVHDLRHHFAVRARQAGAPLEVVRDLLGHQSVATTERYAHVGDEELKDTAAKVRL